MTKIAIIVGGVVLMAGVALAGTLTGLGSSSTPAGQTISPPAATSTTTATLEDRGQENELRGRENEAGEDLRGPCDEAEHANDARCTGAAAAPRADDNAEDVGDDHGGADHSNRGSGGGDDSSGHGGHGGDDD
jgi:hypothetical protein